MALHDVVLRLGTPGDSLIRVDGHDLTNAVRAVNVDSTAVDKPRVTLDLLVHPVEVRGETTVHIPDATRDALVALGWTPPADA